MDPDQPTTKKSKQGLSLRAQALSLLAQFLRYPLSTTRCKGIFFLANSFYVYAQRSCFLVEFNKTVNIKGWFFAHDKFFYLCCIFA